MDNIRAGFNRGRGTDNRSNILLQDIEQVGVTKLLGYLPLSTIRTECDERPYRVKKQAEQRGLRAVIVQEAICDIKSGALFVYEPTQLQLFLLLPRNKIILDRHNWSSNVDEFVGHVIMDIAKDKALYDLVALAFDDSRACYQHYDQQKSGPMAWRF